MQSHILTKQIKDRNNRLKRGSMTQRKTNNLQVDILTIKVGLMKLLHCDGLTPQLL